MALLTLLDLKVDTFTLSIYLYSFRLLVIVCFELIYRLKLLFFIKSFFQMSTRKKSYLFFETEIKINRDVQI